MELFARTRRASLMSALALTSLALGVGSAAGIVWSVVVDNEALWYLVTLVPTCAFWWWIAAGFRRRAANEER